MIYFLAAYGLLTTLFLIRYFSAYEACEEHFYNVVSLLNRSQDRIFELQRQVQDLERVADNASRQA